MIIHLDPPAWERPPRKHPGRGVKVVPQTLKTYDLKGGIDPDKESQKPDRIIRDGS